MKVLDRLLLILVSLLLLCLAAFCVLTLINPDIVAYSDRTAAEVASFFEGIPGKILLGAIALVLFLIAVKFLLMRPKKDKIESFRIRQDDGGDVYISRSAIENTVRMAIANFPDIKESKAHVKIAENGVIVSAKLAIPTGVALPELLENTKSYIKGFTEQTTGVTVLQARLIATEYKPITASDQKKIAAATANAAQEKERAASSLVTPNDKYAKTHATIILSPSSATEQKNAPEAAPVMTPDAPVAEPEQENPDLN